MPISHYQRGANDEIGRELFEVFTPSTVMSMMTRINNSVIVMNRDMEVSKVSSSLKLSFDLFKKNWDTFFDDHQGWISRSLNTTYDMVESFGRQFETYRKAFLREGGKTAVPSITFDRKRGKDKGAIGVSPLTLGLVAASGALLFAYLRR